MAGLQKTRDLVNLAARAVTLPPRPPRQRYRPAQSNIPDNRSVRDSLRSVAASYVEREAVVPPLSFDELRRHTARVLALADVDARYRDFAAIIVNNEVWRETLARIPYDRRLLLLPQCLRAAERCRAPIDEFGLLCQGCGSCVIGELSAEAERLGYAVLVAEGSTVVTQMIETRGIEALVGVSCMSVLEKCFPHMEAAGIPGMAIPLLQDGCADTTVDLDWVRDVIHLTSEDRTARLKLDVLKSEVRGWFTKKSLEAIVGPPRSETEQIACDWLARAGKRWRPYLTACVYMALQADRHDEPPPAPHDLKKLAVAVECFHKASLIHDDIEDDDEQRYGEPALHISSGVPVALNVGDFLLGEGYRLIGELDVDARVKVDMLRTAAAGHLTLSRGQGAELCWARRPGPLSSLEVLDIFRQKTAPAFEVALRLGAFYADADAAVHNALSAYSESLGIAYQIRDDLEDFTGRSDSDDLHDLRPSLILAIAHKRAARGAEAELIAALWNRACAYDDVADEFQRIITERGVADKAQELLEAYTQQATRSLSELKNATLKGLLRRVIGKIFGPSLMEGCCSECEARNAARRKRGAEPAA
jgi:geranylgeranyl diphosphate synthase type II